MSNATGQAAMTDTNAEVPRGDLLDRLPWYTAPALLIGIPLLLGIVVGIDNAAGEPLHVYDKLVWQYYWGPIKADAENYDSLTHDGIRAQSGYNIFNTLSWAALLGLCILGAAQMLRRYNEPMRQRVVIGATAWVVTGSVAHVLEDAGLFATPLQYFFITPIIYLVFAAFGILAYVMGMELGRLAERTTLNQGLRLLWISHVALVLLYTAFWLKPWDQITHYVNPLWVAGFAAVTFLLARARALHVGRIDGGDTVLILSLGWFLLTIAYAISFVRDPWTRVADNAMPSALFWAPALAGALVLLVVFACLMIPRALADNVFMRPVNLLLVFSQGLDGFATALGIDMAGYEEKHVLSARVIDSFRDFAVGHGWEFGATYPTFLAFVPLKFALSLLVVAAIDIYSKDDARDRPALIGLVKFSIIMVGMGPGVRDFVRLALGV